MRPLRRICEKSGDAVAKIAAAITTGDYCHVQATKPKRQRLGHTMQTGSTAF